MKYTIEDRKIIICDLSEFDATHILECGQIFAYKKYDENHYVVFSGDYKAEIFTYDDRVEIQTDNTDYFVNFFDLNTDYGRIKKSLLSFDFMANAINYGNGIRILKQDLLETIVSFVISANNNISRIQKSVFYIREKLGEYKGDYYTFPSLDKLKTADEKFFKNAGLGYRSSQMVKLLNTLSLEKLKVGFNLDTSTLREYLISLTGIGPKVADCILLFAYGKTDVFPVDTWIQKVYNDYFDSEENRIVIRKNLVNIFGNLSGYAQQYLFYYKREKK